MKILIAGDSQANGSPGASAEARLRALGHQTMRVAMDGHGPSAYLNNTDGVWDTYVNAARSFAPDRILLIFGHNPTSELALRRLKDSVPQPVYASGPPRYAATTDQVLSERYRDLFKRVFDSSRYIDAYPWTGPGVPRTPDGWHFTAAGGPAWGVPLADELNRRITASPLSSGSPDHVDRGGPGNGSSSPGLRSPIRGGAKKRP